MGATTVSVSRAWSDLAVQTSWDTLPSGVRHVARLVLADALGSALSGARSSAVDHLAAALSDLGSTGSVPVPGRTDAWTVGAAAMIAGVAVRSAGSEPAGATDPDTGFRPAASVGAAVMAAGLAGGAVLGEALSAVALGTEIGCRLADALEPAHTARGWDLDTTVGHVAASVAVGRLLRLTPVQLVHAVSVAATEAAGHRAQHSTEAWALQAGQAAGDAVEAALMAEHGFVGPSLAIEGRRGLLALMGDGGAPDPLTRELGERWVAERLLRNDDGPDRQLREWFRGATHSVLGADGDTAWGQIMDGDGHLQIRSILDHSAY